MNAEAYFSSNLGDALVPMSDLTLEGIGRVFGRVAGDSCAVLCGDRGVAIELDDVRTLVEYSRLVVEWPPLQSWLELQTRGRAVLVLGNGESKWALEFKGRSFSGLVNALRHLHQFDEQKEVV